jgi:hypothetical protein
VFYNSTSWLTVYMCVPVHKWAFEKDPFKTEVGDSFILVVEPADFLARVRRKMCQTRAKILIICGLIFRLCKKQ